MRTSREASPCKHMENVKNTGFGAVGCDPFAFRNSRETIDRVVVVVIAMHRLFHQPQLWSRLHQELSLFLFFSSFDQAVIARCASVTMLKSMLSRLVSCQILLLRHALAAAFKVACVPHVSMLGLLVLAKVLAMVIAT
jgi:hypothetical protein